MNTNISNSYLFQKKNNLKSRYGSKGMRASKISLNKSQAFEIQSMLGSPKGIKASKNKIVPMVQHTLSVSSTRLYLQCTYIVTTL